MPGRRDSASSQVAHTLLQIQMPGGDLEQAEKLVVDDVVHIDHDHATDIIRVELTNNLKVPMVINNTTYTPKKVFHIRPTGSIHTVSSIYAKVVHAELPNGTQVDIGRTSTTRPPTCRPMSTISSANWMRRRTWTTPPQGREARLCQYDDH